ncbi:Putative F-box protein [Striga hermonthica]|uniref:F-box protein n=1 Tax=Striga hermonthica TaxID=68872 RepID=A0A9N7N1F2_STRHE|nr:Putative F-box protein [Striga hermonthica]
MHKNRKTKSSSNILWNPTSQEIKIIPRFPYYELCFKDLVVGLGFDPAKPQAYKMVKIRIDECDFKAPPEFRAELYSLETDCWRKIEYPYQQGIPTERASVRVGSTNYWGLISRPCSIISFHFASEKFSPSLIPLPGKIKFKKSDYLLVEFDGSLAILLPTNVVSDIDQVPCSSFKICVWNDESWSRKSKFEIPIAVDHVIGLFENDKLFVQDMKGNVLLYECAMCRLAGLGICADSKAVWILPYVESSVPLTNFDPHTNFVAKAESILNSLSSTSAESHVDSPANEPQMIELKNNTNTNNDKKMQFLFMYVFKEISYFSVVFAETSWKVDELRSNNFIMFTPKITKPVKALLGGTYNIAASIDELMLVCSWDYYARGARKNYILWNPTSQEAIKTIPFSPYHKCSDIIGGLSGLGFDPAKPRGYKILDILIDYCDFEDFPKLSAKLYSLETGSWSKIKYPYQHESMPDERASVRIGSSYYFGLSSRPNSIISFDFATEKFSRRVLPLPDKIRFRATDYLLVEIDGSLAILLQTDELDNPQVPYSAFLKNAAQVPYSTFEIWVWNDESWSLKSKLKIPFVVYRVVGLLENDKLFVQDMKRKVLLYDCGTCRLVDLGICADYGVVCKPYVQSSVPLHASE